MFTFVRLSTQPLKEDPDLSILLVLSPPPPALNFVVKTLNSCMRIKLLRITVSFFIFINHLISFYFVLLFIASCRSPTTVVRACVV